MMYRRPTQLPGPRYVEHQFKVRRFKAFWPDRGRQPISESVAPYGRGLVQFFSAPGYKLQTVDVSDIILIE